MKLENRLKIILLWIVFLSGMMTHCQLAAMPIFFGADISMPEATGSMPASMKWMCLLFYLIPMLLIVGAMLFDAKWFRITNLVLSGLFGLMNTFHLYEHFLETPKDMAQVVLLGCVFVFGIYQCVASFKWVKDTGWGKAEP